MPTESSRCNATTFVSTGSVGKPVSPASNCDTLVSPKGELSPVAASTATGGAVASLLGAVLLFCDEHAAENAARAVHNANRNVIDHIKSPRLANTNALRREPARAARLGLTFLVDFRESMASRIYPSV